MPRGLQHERGINGQSRRVRTYRARLRPDENTAVRWDEPPVEDREVLSQFDDDVRSRVIALHEWLETLKQLISTVQSWANELGWSSKVIEKPLEDSTIGSYTAPALLLQEETTRMLLEPICAATGTHGVADLYLMPAYDDIASLYYDGQKWRIHYAKASDSNGVGKLEAESKPLSKASLRNVLEELKSHAA